MKPPAALLLFVGILLLGLVRSTERLQAKPGDEFQLLARQNSHVSEDQAGDALPSSMPGDSPSSSDASSSSIPSDAPTSGMPSDAPTSSMPNDAPSSSMPSDSPFSSTTSDAPSSSMPTDAPSSDISGEALYSSTLGYSLYSSMEKELKNITDDILRSVSRQDLRCLSVCNEVLTPACERECKRRGISALMCRLICYSMEIRCCKCPVFCHDPFLQCYLSCPDRNTPCKDVCMERVNSCCDLQHDLV